MAKLKLEGLEELDNLIKGLSDLGSDINEVAKDCINAAAPTLENALKKNIRSVTNRKDKRTGKPYSTGELERSIAATEAKTNAYGNFAAIRPVGTDANGVRNGEKLAYLEYGTSEQEARPVMQKSINEAEPQTKEIIQKHFEEHVQKRMK